MVPVGILVVSSSLSPVFSGLLEWGSRDGFLGTSLVAVGLGVTVLASGILLGFLAIPLQRRLAVHEGESGEPTNGPTGIDPYGFDQASGTKP